MEQNNATAEKKETILKSLAIAGFIGILVLLAWLSMQLVHLFPSAVTSLASLAEGVNEYQETTLDTSPELLPLTVTANTSVVNSGESVQINWSKVNTNGSYVFTYECTEGISLMLNSELGTRAIDCDTNYNIGDIDTLSLTMNSEKNRYTDVMYTIAFLRTNDTEPRAQGGDRITVVNSDINSQFVSSTDPVPETNEAVTDSSTDSQNESVNTQQQTEPIVSPEPFEQEFVYTIPVSDPNGISDLAVTFINTGEIINNEFIAGPVSTANAGAIQFSVRNIGTKTTQDWMYSIALPNSNEFVSQDQVGLKPNERAVITIGFPAGTNNQHTFVVTVDEPADRNNTNDTFRRTVLFAE